MRKMLLGAALLALPIAACKKTGEGEYQVEISNAKGRKLSDRAQVRECLGAQKYCLKYIL